jgi:hypothetical protein
MAEDLEQNPSDVASESPPLSKEAVQSPGAPLEVSIVTDENTGGLQQYPVSDAIRVAAESGLIRNQAAKFFLQPLVRLREVDLADARKERQSAREDVEHFKENFFKEQTKNAVLTERLRGELKLKKLQNILITLGGVMLGIGLQPIFTVFSAAYFVVALLGLVLLIAGWFYPTDSTEENR